MVCGRFGFSKIGWRTLVAFSGGEKLGFPLGITSGSLAGKTDGTTGASLF